MKNVFTWKQARSAQAWLKTHHPMRAASTATMAVFRPGTGSRPRQPFRRVPDNRRPFAKDPLRTQPENRTGPDRPFSLVKAGF